MRVPYRSVLPIALLAAACGGGDLTLPGPGDPASLSIVSGDAQQATVGEPVPDPLVVELLDGAGRPVRGAAVAFRFADSPPGAVVDPTTPATDTLGRASATARLGNVVGAQPIDAQVAMPGQDLLVRFRLTAVDRPRDDGDDDGGGGGGGSAAPTPSSGEGDQPGDGGRGGDGGSNDDGGHGHRGGHDHDNGRGHDD